MAGEVAGNFALARFLGGPSGSLTGTPNQRFVEQAYLDKREMQYLYQDGDGYVFMDTETFDQITLGKEWAGDLMMYMKEGKNAQVVFYETNPISLELPAPVDAMM